MWISQGSTESLAYPLVCGPGVPSMEGTRAHVGPFLAVTEAPDQWWEEEF